MPSIDNSFLSVKTPAQQDVIKPAAAVEPEALDEKPFSQHLQDEIEKESEDSVLADVSEQDEVDELPEAPALTLVNADSTEENDLLLSGNSLPVQQETDEARLEVEASQTKPLIVTEMLQQQTTSKEISSQSIKLSSSVPIEPEMETTTADQFLEPEELEAPVIKVQKQVIDGQLNTKTELTVNDSGKSLKLVQVASVNTISTAESVKNPIDSSVMQSQLSTPVNHKQWGSELSQRINVMINNGQQQVAELRLNPAHLGPLNVRLQLDEDQANISFITNNQAVKEAIETSLPRLREQLQQQGLDLGQVDIEKRDQQEASSDSEASQQAKEFAGDIEATETELQDTISTISINSGVSVFV